MTDAQRQVIAEAAHRHAVQSRAAQGLPPTVTDPDVLRKIVILMSAGRRERT